MKMIVKMIVKDEAAAIIRAFAVAAFFAGIARLTGRRSIEPASGAWIYAIPVYQAVEADADIKCNFFQKPWTGSIPVGPSHLLPGSPFLTVRSGHRQRH